MKRLVSGFVSVVLVLTLALSFSVESRAGSRVYGAPQTYTRTIKVSNSSVGPATYHPTFNVYDDDEWPGGSLAASCRFDFYAYSNSDGILTPGTNYDGYLIDVSTTGSKYQFSNMGAFSVVLGSNSSVARDESLAIVNSPFWNNRTFVDYDCATYGYDRIYIWLLGRSARSFTSVGSTGNTATTRSSFDVDITLQITVYPYVDSQASSADINNQTNSLNQATQNQTNSLNQATQNQTNSLNQATQNQTNTLTGGYDNAGMEQTNKELQSSLATYEQSESQVTGQSVAYIDAVTFFDPTTHLQLMTSVTFISSFLQDLFVALGDFSVLVTIALSLAFALMLVGWFKYRK